ncbi:MAG: hypothetical protein RBG13Loki_2637 [Promethearchaeota archaeon CR_4]|nr:MAG: hypothetical protein RBG13Loki_2637 [Candidatus Lokiarchaeota archaeon CR_4]
MKNSVALLKYKQSPDSLREAIALCDGFSGLKPAARILIKPNLVMWDNNLPISPFGVFTTTRLVEDLVLLLQEAGCTDITIGDGSMTAKPGSSTADAFVGLGYESLVTKYHVKLVDFNKSPGLKLRDAWGYEMQVAKEVLDTNFLINMPVLKTHGQTKVSLGIKNLKGCLKMSSKRLCHDPARGGLEHAFSVLPDLVKPALTIIDGIYALEQGPLVSGKAIRKNVVIVSKDILGADLVAAKSIGYDPEDILHFKELAHRTGKSLDLNNYQVKGEKLENHITPLKWDWPWTKDDIGPLAFERAGIHNVEAPKYDETVCSGCSLTSYVVNMLVLSAVQGKPAPVSLPRIEILNGKKRQARAGYDATVLIGNCIAKANAQNPHIRKALKVTGCPPEYLDIVETLRGAGLDVKDNAYVDALHQQYVRYEGKPEFSWRFFGK